MISFTLDSDFVNQRKWMRQKSRVIGNIGTMASIIEEPIINRRLHNCALNFTTSDFYNHFLSQNDMKIIFKYLPNYDVDYQKPIQDAIVYMTASLRNILRGHGSFDGKDAFHLYKIVFKLSLLNSILLGINDVVLVIDKTRVWEDVDESFFRVIGRTGPFSSKLLSPFLIAKENGSILVFNNWKKSEPDSFEQIEYINYLDGTLILPEYRSFKI